MMRPNIRERSTARGPARRRSFRPALSQLEGRSLLSTIYFNDFESGIGSGWTGTPTAPQISTTPIGGRNFLGEFANDTEKLTVPITQSHTQVTVSFDLFILRTWDGIGPASGPLPVSVGPDTFQLKIGGNQALSTTFSLTGN